MNDTETIRKALGLIVEKQAELQNGGDVAWALWGAVVLNVQLSNRAQSAIEKMSDPIAILMALYAETKSIFTTSLDKSAWTSYITKGELYDSRWILAYEAFGQGWVSTPSGDPVSSDPYFQAARYAGIQFMDIDAKLEIPKPSNHSDASGK